MADDVERLRRELIRRVHDGIGSLPFVAFLSEYEYALIAAAEARGRELEKAKNFEELVAAGERLFTVRGERDTARKTVDDLGEDLGKLSVMYGRWLSRERDAALLLAGTALDLLQKPDWRTSDRLLARPDAQAALRVWREQQ